MIEEYFWVISKRADLTPLEKLVLLRLAIEQGRSKDCSIAMSHLASQVRADERGIRRIIKKLEAMREITCERKRVSATENDQNTYKVIWVNNWNRKQKWLANNAKSVVA